MKICTKCKQSKNKSYFGKSKNSLDGLYSHCKGCRNLHTKSMTEQDRKHRREIRLINDNKKYQDPEKNKECRLKNFQYFVKHRAKLKNIPYDLDYQWIKENCPKICPILGIPLFFNNE